MARAIGRVGAGNDGMKSVAAEAAAGQLGMGAAAAAAGAAGAFQDEQGAAFANDEAVAVFVKRTRRRRRVGVALDRAPRLPKEANATGVTLAAKAPARQRSTHPCWSQRRAGASA